MYYEEKLIDGVWQWRGTPDGEWRTMGVATLTRMLAEAHERERAYRNWIYSTVFTKEREAGEFITHASN